MTSPKDHPRLRGEHLIKLSFTMARSGSPPPTRGTHICLCCRLPYWRITPAYAGNTFCLSWNTHPCEDHPRLRGEHSSGCCLKSFDLGSPPPTRGTPFTDSIVRLWPRITPAYAGNTNRMTGATNPIEDHPRLRGEHSRLACAKGYLLGSPPPTRGTHIVASANIDHLGDHPRLRGEHLSSQLSCHSALGSPPPTRGTLNRWF